jgi:hypothetical protein
MTRGRLGALIAGVAVVVAGVAGAVTALTTGDGDNAKSATTTTAQTATTGWTQPQQGGTVPNSTASSSSSSSSSSSGSGSSSVSINIKSAVHNGSGLIQVRGTATPGCTATVNRAPVAIGPDGTWSVDVPVTAGGTTVTATALSADGRNRSSSRVTVRG